MTAKQKTESFGQRITRLLHDHRETPADLGRVCGVSRQTAWKWANDKSPVPDDEYITKMARHWRKTEAYIRYGDEVSAPAPTPVMEYDGDLMKAVVIAARKKVAELGYKLTPETEGELIDLLYRNFAGRQQSIDEGIITQVVRLAGGPKK